ncbi:MAG TPA: hypothetical protein VFZ25_16485 [Chloroflexota bacterium]|nr:hypothetical protein [Chloroflexota bacterium]
MSRYAQLLVLAIAVALSLGVWAPALAASSSPATTAITLTSSPRLDAKGKPMKGQYLITATLTANGQPINQAALAFREHVDFFGPRDADLGTVLTDSTGSAVIFYQPADNGPKKISAQFAGSQTYAATSGSATIDARDVTPLFTSHPEPLASVGKWLSVSLGILGVVFWAVVLGIFIRAIGRIRAAARGPERASNARPAAGRAPEFAAGGIAVQRASPEPSAHAPGQP